ncbi:CheR family methyltransferase [Stutzerimonas kirkiae]|uniref:Chemotaxis protein CheR n=1 Tax=Stutzerimonas kirkiae TaxID=2211392 RepID=A0A4Q9R5L2_9GAMM|nr:protein-glutamate O-methyltransferase CheR [Stutzerimonas kirkiae]TBU94793.1 chemotaxis protein CheR [Stutzerimonas kirkiae]TBV01879.1 chemotaxis protein CheR [Stutzerimonas kirkiae]TBV07178.1 chemotaxis protein CheR [Stutzerimonas kirkiae]
MIEHIERLLKSRIGLDAESVGRSVIERAVRQRMGANAQQAMEDYWATLNGSRREQQALVEAVVVPETWFFRYPESFRALASLALESQARIQGARPLRLISLPCSSGEEPYSIAMALLDAGLAPGHFQIDALDVSDRVVVLARRGFYGRNSFRGESLEFRERFFRQQPDGFSLDERVRDCVRFRCGNLLDDKLFSSDAPYDFIFCRNLLIYFDRPTQVRVLESLKRQLQPQGILFIGPAEASLASQNGMQALGYPQTFAFRFAPAEAAKVVPARYPASRATPAPRKAPVVRPRAVIRAIPPAAPGAPAGPVLATDIWQEVAELANAGRSDEARKRCEQHLQAGGPCAEGFYWLGLLSDADARSGQACDYYRKAIYLDPRHSEALTHLAAHLEARGDPAGARRLYERARQQEVDGRE